MQDFSTYASEKASQLIWNYILSNQVQTGLITDFFLISKRPHINPIIANNLLINFL